MRQAPSVAMGQDRALVRAPRACAHGMRRGCGPSGWRATSSGGTTTGDGRRATRATDTAWPLRPCPRGTTRPAAKWWPTLRPADGRQNRGYGARWWWWGWRHRRPGGVVSWNEEE